MSRWSLLLAALVLVSSACGRLAEPDVAVPPPAAEAARGWEALPASPLGPRTEAHAFWTGERVLVIGGNDARPCPPGADCARPADRPATDGAWFDPASGDWAGIAPTPLPLGDLTGTVLPDALYVFVPGWEVARDVRAAFLVYRVDDDAWEELAAPPIPAGTSLTLAAAADRIVAYHGSQEQGIAPDLLYDPATGEWSDLPADPLQASFDRSMVWTGHELLLTGIPLRPDPDPAAPPVYRAAALDPTTGVWRRLPDSPVVGWDPSWYWADGRLINPTPGSADGGEVNNWGRDYPFGGILDPGAGVWSPLPVPPERLEGIDAYQGLSVGGDEYLVSSRGFVLHVPTLSWARLTKPRAGEEAGAASVWAGDRLFVWGGVRANGAAATLLDNGWTWRP